MADDLGELGRLTVRVKTGEEQFMLGDTPAKFDLMSFWQWSTSDLVANSIRGVLAEYLVAKSLELDVDKPRDPWAKFDLTTKDGLKIEVKSAAALQSWHQTRLSDLSFGYRKTLGWDGDTNTLASEEARHADVYVFALLAHTHKPTVDPMQLEQWKFYVVVTAALDARVRSQHSITIRSLERECAKDGATQWCGPVAYGAPLAEAIARVAAHRAAP